MITWWLATTPSPSPSPSDTQPIEAWEASPGFAGFMYGFIFLGIALALLMWSMTRHLRRLRHNPDPNAAPKQAAEPPAGAAPGGTPDGDRPTEDQADDPPASSGSRPKKRRK